MSDSFFIILAPLDDIHAQAVLREAKLLGSEKTCIIDLSRSNDYQLSWLSSGELHISGTCGELNLSQVSSVWWRRPSMPNVTSFDAATNEYCNSEYSSFLKSAFSVLEAKGVVKNSLRGRHFGNSKIRQLEVAKEVGFTIPHSLITNSRDQASGFCKKSESELIAKGFGGTRERFSPTQLVLQSDLVRLESLRHSPIILQQRISRGRDHRVTVVNGEVFCGTVETGFEGADVDWRNDAAATCSVTDLGADVVTAIRKLTMKLELFFCTIDLMEDPAGTLHFLEVNESGQFLFVEIDTGLSISASLAHALLQ